MTHIIDPKTEKQFPTATEFTAKIEVFKDDIAYVAVCKHCGGKMAGHIKMKNACRLNEQQADDTVLGVIAKRHVCLYKQSQWSDKSLIRKVAPDIMRGLDKLKEQVFRDKRSGKA